MSWGRSANIRFRQPDTFVSLYFEANPVLKVPGLHNLRYIEPDFNPDPNFAAIPIVVRVALDWSLHASTASDLPPRLPLCVC